MLAPLVALVAFLQVALCNRVVFDSGNNAQVCEGIYSKQEWGGKFRPHVGLKLLQWGSLKYDSKKPDDSPDDIKISYVIFEFKDIVYLGKDTPNGRKYICDSDAILGGLCDSKDEGQFIVNLDISNTTVKTSQLTKLGQAHIDYNVLRTGYYCVLTISTLEKYKGLVNFQNAFGHLSAAEIPKLPAYGILTLCYALALALFGFQFFKKRHQNQILPLQRYLLAMFGFLTFDTLVVWLYYDLVNRTAAPLNGFVIFYLIFLSLLNAVKMTFSLFLLLCIALGYGVAVLKLPKSTMFKCKILAGVHFCTSMFYLVATYWGASSNSLSVSLSVAADDQAGSLWDIVPLLPIAVTLTTYYVCILAAMRNTSANLHKQRQVIKLQLYLKLFTLIFMLVVFTVGGLVLSSFVILTMSTTDIVEQHWRSFYFLYEFWPSLVFYVVFLGVAWLWRPTETSYMLAVSQQVASDDTAPENQGPGGNEFEFELDDMSLMSHSDNENNNHRDSFELNNLSVPNDSPPKYDENWHKKSAEAPSGEQSNTLFELGDDDEEHQSDTRLQGSK